jgi:hypothetical protein
MSHTNDVQTPECHSVRNAGARGMAGVPAEVLLMMLSHSDVLSVINFGRTNREYFKLSHNRLLWQTLLEHRISVYYADFPSA